MLSILITPTTTTAVVSLEPFHNNHNNNNCGGESQTLPLTPTWVAKLLAGFAHQSAFARQLPVQASALLDPLLASNNNSNNNNHDNCVFSAEASTLPTRRLHCLVLLR